MTRPDIHSAAITLASLPEPDAQIVCREAETGSEVSLRSALESTLRAERSPVGSSLIAVPKETEEAGLADAWRAGSRRALQLPEQERTLERCLPAYAREIEADAKAGSDEQGRWNDETAVADSELQRIDIQRDFELGRISSGEDFEGRARRWKRISLGLFLVEAAGIYVAVGAAHGLTDGIPLSAVQGGTWIQVIGMGTLVNVAMFAVSFLGVQRVGSLQLGERFNRAAVAMAIVTAILMAVSLGIIRWWGTRDAYELNPGAMEVGAVAFLVIVTLASGVVVLAAAVARLHAERAQKEADVISKVERRYALEAAAPLARREKAEAELARLAHQIHLPLTLATAFESAVKQAEEEARATEAAFANRLEQAFGAFRQLRALPPELRVLVTSEVFVLRQPAQGGQDGEGRSRRFGRAAPTLLSLTLVVGLGSGCGEETPSPSLVVACDGTGIAPEVVCNTDLLSRRFVAWAEPAAYRPGVSFTVVLSAGSYGATSPAFRAVIPQTWSGRGERAQWMAAQVRALSSLVVPRTGETRPGERTENLSDLVSLVSVASREARGMQGPVELLLATDGWLVSLGVDTEAEAVPEPMAFLARLKAADVPWNLSVFTRTVVCGLTNRGSTAGKVAGRDRLLGELFKAGAAPTPEVYTSCRDLYPPVPAPLLAATSDETSSKDEIAAQVSR